MTYAGLVAAVGCDSRTRRRDEYVNRSSAPANATVVAAKVISHPGCCTEQTTTINTLAITQSNAKRRLTTTQSLEVSSSE